jgi:hypothetical protein
MTSHISTEFTNTFHNKYHNYFSYLPINTDQITNLTCPTGSKIIGKILKGNVFSSGGMG